MNNNQTTNTLRQAPPPPQPAQPDLWAVPQYPQQSYFQPPLVPAYHLQWAGLHLSQPLPSEQSPFYTNHDYGSQQHQYRQHQYHVPPPVPLQLATHPGYNPYQPTVGYAQQYFSQSVASPQPQLSYYSHPQHQQQQQCWYHTLPQHLPRMMTGRQRFDSPNLVAQTQHHVLLSPRPQFVLPLPFAENTTVYSGQTQESCGGYGRGTGGLMSGNEGEIADKGWHGSSYMDSGGGVEQAGRSGGDLRSHCSGGNFGGVASIQAEGRNTIPISVERLEPAAVHVATQLEGAQGFNISGNPVLTNIGMNTGVHMTTVNNYGGIHGLENLKEFVSFAALYDSAEQDPDRCCHPGTRKTVLTQLRNWINNSNIMDRIIWLHGPAGAGKSAIAQTIADEYEKQGVAATFFFSRSDPSRNDGNRLFPTIAWQLAFSIPPTKDFIVHALHQTPHLPTKAVESQFEQLIAHPFEPTNSIASRMSHPAPVVIIDGVDECSDEKLQQRFLTVIGNAVKNHRVPLRFFVVSRPEALIEEALDKFKDFAVSIDLAKLDDSNRDIRKYLEDKFSEIASNRDLDPTWPGLEIIEEIAFKSSGNFIFASLVIRFISDEDYDPEFLLDIVRDLTPRGSMSPFALLDELFLEILKRQRDQNFLKTFLYLLVARSSIKQKHLHEDDAILMNVSEKDLHTKLRRMRSLLKFEPFIDVYHKSFLDFLQEPSRSGQYHVSKEGGLKQYLELVVGSVVRHVTMAIEQPNRHETCHLSPEFKYIVHRRSPKILLPVEEWQDAVKPLLDLQVKLLKTSKPQSCRVTQVMRDLFLHLVFLQGKSHAITAAQALEPNMNEPVTQWGLDLVTETQQNTSEKDLDACLSLLLSCLQKTVSQTVIDRAIIDHMFSLLAFDYAEIVSRVRTVSNAQKLIDLIDLLTNNEYFIRQCGLDAACKATRLASEIFARVPLLPQSLFLNKPVRYIRAPTSNLFESECQSAFIGRILDHNYIIPALGINDGGDRLMLASGNENEQNETVDGWLKRSSPNLVTRIRLILEVARTIQYIHSMDVTLYSECIQLKFFFLNSDLRPKFAFIGLFAWWVREASIYGHEESIFWAACTYESNVSAFARLFDSVCFDSHREDFSVPLVEDARQLIERCWAKDSKRRPTMKDVVKEMETWNLT